MNKKQALTILSNILTSDNDVITAKLVLCESADRNEPLYLLYYKHGLGLMWHVDSATSTMGTNHLNDQCYPVYHTLDSGFEWALEHSDMSSGTHRQSLGMKSLLLRRIKKGGCSAPKEILLF